MGYVVAGWLGGVSRLRNEPVLFNQCSVFYTAWKLRVSCRLSWLLGASSLDPNRGSAPPIYLGD